MNAISIESALAALVTSEASKTAAIAKPEKSAKVRAAKGQSKASVAREAKADRARHESRCGNPVVASSFGTYRPESREINGTPVVFGAAGADHEYNKMRLALGKMIPVAFDEAEEAMDNAETCERLAALAESEGDSAKAGIYSAEAVVQRGLHAVKLELCKVIQGELDRDNHEEIVRRYRNAGNSELVTENVIAVECGSLGGGMLTEDDKVVEVQGEAYAMPETTEATARRIRCRFATMLKGE